MENLNLGKCCICETESDSVRNVITLDKKTSETKGGWGCFVCDLEPLGAVAVLCDGCLDKWMAKQIDIKFACLGYPGENRRIETEKLTTLWAHDLSKHPEEAEETAVSIIQKQEFITCGNCGYSASLDEGGCGNCGETVCFVCGCTESAACPEGCYWVAPNVCSVCAYF